MPIEYACIQPASRVVEADAPRLAAAHAGVTNEIASYAADVLVRISAPAMLPSVIGVSGGEGLARLVELEAKKDALPVRVSKPAPDADDASVEEGAVSLQRLEIGVARLNLRAHFEFGRALARVLDADARRIAIACVADVSRTRDARAGRAFDEHYRRAIESWDVKWLVGLDAETRRRAGESIAATTSVLMGALGAYRIQPRVLSYEVVGDAGLLVAAIDVLGGRRG